MDYQKHATYHVAANNLTRCSCWIGQHLAKSPGKTFGKTREIVLCALSFSLAVAGLALLYLLVIQLAEFSFSFHSDKGH